MKTWLGAPMRPIVYTMLIVVWSALILSPFLDKDDMRDCGQVMPGVIDLSDCVFDDKEVYKLNGEWEFYWKQLLSPGDFAGLHRGGHVVEYTAVPSQWTNTLQLQEGVRYGYATYRVKLRLPGNPQFYGLKVTNVRTSSRLFVNGRLSGQSGMPGTSRDTAESRNTPYAAFFNVEGREAEIVLQASNFIYRSSGVAEPVYAGSAAAIERLLKRNEMLDFAVIVGLVLMGFYFGGQGLQRSRDRASLFLALFCIMTALYMASHSEKLLYMHVPGMTYATFYRIQSLSSVIAIWALIGYTHHINRKKYSALLFKLASVLVGLYVLISGLSGGGTTSFAEPVMLIWMFIACLYIVYAMIRAIVERITGSTYLLIAMLGMIQYAAQQVANLILLSDVYAQPPIGIFTFILAQGLFLAARSNHAFEIIQNLTMDLQKKGKDKDEFLVKMSHELQTPLQAMRHIIRSLLKGVGGKLNAQHRKDMLLVEHASKRLSFLINDILDYERMKDGRVELNRKPLELSGLVEVVLEVFRHLHLNDHTTLMNQVVPRAFIIDADEDRVTQIIYNLIETAMHGVASGKIEVSAAMDAEYGQVTIMIAVFGQKSSSEPMNDGLGLSLSRMLTELHGGTFTEEKVAGCEMLFRFSMPTFVERSSRDLLANQKSITNSSSASVANSVLADAGESGPRSLLERETVYHVLIVDEYVQGRALTNLLRSTGMETTEVCSGSQALGQLADGRSYDLAIVDALLPDMSGFALCRHIRQTKSLIDLPILMTTVNSRIRINESGQAAGANDLIRKPYEWEDMLARVRTLVQLKRSVTELLRAEVAMLRAQIKPHFLYNAFNTIIWMSKRDIERTRQLIRDLSNFLRGTFDFENRETLVPLETELSFIKAYLSLEQARLGERLQVIYELESIEPLIPPLLIQPIVENAVRHGIGDNVEQMMIVIAVRRTDSEVEIVISDNGVGMTPEQLNNWKCKFEILNRSEGTGIGLGIVNRRMMNMFGKPLEIAMREGGGTVVTIRLPGKENRIGT